MEVLEANDEHLDAEALYDQAKVLDPNISLATVYRTLGVLKEMGLIEEHRLGEEHSHYESVRHEPHYHFSCLGCGRVIEFSTSLVTQIEHELIEREGIHVVNAHLHLSGYCSQCQRQNQNGAKQ
jgi:Fe2+ or Zn2+ uptake regulation protein